MSRPPGIPSVAEATLKIASLNVRAEARTLQNSRLVQRGEALRWQIEARVGAVVVVDDRWRCECVDGVAQREAEVQIVASGARPEVDEQFVGQDFVVVEFAAAIGDGGFEGSAIDIGSGWEADLGDQ